MLVVGDTQRQHVELEVVVQALDLLYVVVIWSYRRFTEEQLAEVGEVLHALDFLDGAVARPDGADLLEGNGRLGHLLQLLDLLSLSVGQQIFTALLG